MTYTLSLYLGTWLSRYVSKNEEAFPENLIQDPDKKYSYLWTGHAPTTAEELLITLGIPLSEVGMLTKNGQAIPFSQVLNEDCQMAFYPMIVGG